MYARRIGDRDYTFGVSGLLYASNVLMYDHQTESLWLQVRRSAVTGPMNGTRLAVLPSTVTSWAGWKKQHPDSLVLSTDTGHERDYSRDPYESYYKSGRGLFSRLFSSPGSLDDKELVAGIEIGGAHKAYPVGLLRSRGRLEDVAGKERIVLTWDSETDSLTIITVDGDPVEHLVAYWFVWKDIHPDTAIFRGESTP